VVNSGVKCVQAKQMCAGCVQAVCRQMKYKKVSNDVG
jgi:hypothetical protein